MKTTAPFAVILILVAGLAPANTGFASDPAAFDGWLIAPAPHEACSFVVARKGEVLLTSRRF